MSNNGKKPAHIKRFKKNFEKGADMFGAFGKKKIVKNSPRGKKSQYDQPFSMINFEMFDDYLNMDTPHVYESQLFIKEKRLGGLMNSEIKYYAKYSKENEILFYDHKKSLKVVKTIRLQNATYEVDNSSSKRPFKIRIFTKKKKKYTLRARNQMEFSDWSTLLKKFGLKDKRKAEVEADKNIDLPSHQQSFLKKAIKEWNNNDILEFSKIYKIGDDYESLYNICGGELKKKNVNGIMLLMLDKTQILNFLLSIGIKNFVDRNLFRNDLLQMRKTGMFKMEKVVVKEKAIILHRKHNMEITPLELDKWAKDKEELYNPIILKKKIESYLVPERSGNKDKGKTYKWRIKLIITENLRDERMKYLRKIFGGFLKVVPKMKPVKFGMFHTAISLGNCQLDWNDSSFVHLRKNMSTNVLLCLDVDNFQKKARDLDEFILELANICVAWNTATKYDSMKKNCQHFVIDLLKWLGIKYRFSGATQKFLDRMKYKGVCEMEFDCSDSKFFKKFKKVLANYGLEKSKNAVFKPGSHKELDDFMSKLLKVCPQFESEHYSEWELLKGFDRAFWMKHYRGDGKDIRVKPSSNGCPFNKK